MRSVSDGATRRETVVEGLVRRLAPEPEVNVPLLRKVMEHIEAHPEEWNQTAWREVTECGTAYCFAGHAVAMMGATWAEVQGNERGHYLVPEPDEQVVDDEYEPRGVARVQDRAQRLLGLSPIDANRLFWARNSLETLQVYVAELEEHGAIMDRTAIARTDADLEA